MKNTVKFTAIAAALVGMASVSGAQASLNSSLTATAAVGASISITPANIDFGTAYRNQPAVTIAANAATAASFLVAGTGGSTVGTTITAPSTLASAATPTNTLPVTWTYSSISTNGACTTAAAGSATAVTSLELSGSAGGTGNGRICIGGTITPTTSTAIATDYAGTISITVAFP
jgi:hypothetical protein